MSGSVSFAVTGAFGFTGSAVAARLLASGHPVRTLTNHPRHDHPLAALVPAFALDFTDPDRLAHSLDGCEVLINTYWIRFPYRGLTFEGAVENTRTLLRAARQAGVRRIVHISIANPSADSPLPYYRGKARAEEAVAASGMSHTIIRPTLLYGQGDILLNNIAWMLRRLPVFALPGTGHYRVQPILLDDLADLIVAAALGDANETFDAAGPDVMTFRELVQVLARAVGSRAFIVPAPAFAAFLASRAMSLVVRDVILTAGEVVGLRDELLISHEPPRGTTRLQDWLAGNADGLGREYASELQRHYRPWPRTLGV